VFGGHLSSWENEQSYYRSSSISTVNNDLYQFDIERSEWEIMESELPTCTCHCSIVIDDKIWIMGGFQNAYTHKTFTFHLQTRITEEIIMVDNGMSRRSGHTVIEWNRKAFLFGGWTGRVWFQDCWVLDLDSAHLGWKPFETSGDIPSKRCSHLAALFGNCMYIFGGFDGQNYFATLHQLNLETSVWKDITNEAVGTPPARSRSAVVTCGNCMYVIGGWDRKIFFADLWEYNFVTKKWKQINNRFGVPVLSQHSAVVVGNTIYVFGGFDGSKMLHRQELFRCQLMINDEIG